MRGRLAAAISVAAVALLPTLGAGAPWRAIGPTGGDVGALAITSANTWYVSSETYRGSVVHRSRDDGATWEGLGEIAINDSELFIDRTTDPDTVLAWGDGVQRLVDGEDRWREASFRTVSGDATYLYVSSIVRLGDGVDATLVLAADEGTYASTDHGASWTAVESAPSRISALAVDPTSNPPRVLAAVSDGAIVASSDLMTWSLLGYVPVFGAPTDAPAVYTMAVDARAPVARLFASLRQGNRIVPAVTELSGGGIGGWFDVAWPAAGESITAFATDDGADVVFYTCSPSGCRLARPGTGLFLEDLGETIPGYVGSVSLARELPIVAAGCAGVLAMTIEGRWTSRTGNLSARSIDAVALDDSGEADVIYAMDGSCAVLVRSTDQGATWTRLAEDLDVDGGLMLDRTVSPARVYVTTYDALYASDDHGDSFRRVLDVGWLPAIDTSTSPPTLFVDSGVFLFRSRDGGVQWDVLPTPWGGTKAEPVIATLAVDVGTKPVRLLAATDYGIHISTDAGVSWQYANRGLADRDEPNGTELWVYVADIVVASRPRNLTILVTDDGIYTSRGNGPTWKRERSGLVSVIDDEFVEFTVASSGRTTIAGGDDGRLYVRDRKRRQWRWVNRGQHKDFRSVISLALGTSRAPRVLVGTWGAGIFDRASAHGN